MPVKQNHPHLFEAIQAWFEKPLTLRGLDKRCAKQTNKAHGRLESRTLQATTELNDYLDWPALAQVLRLERCWTNLKTGQTTTEIRYAITNLTPAQADAPTLLRLWRNHWTIENLLHWSRDVLFAEDRSRLSSQHAPRVFAVLRNAALSALNVFHPGSLTAARDYCAAQPLYAFGLLARPVSDWFT
jgi:Transposase DDE domain